VSTWIAIIIGFATTGALLQRCAGQRQILRDTHLDGEHAIEELAQVELGGSSQKVLIRGHDRSLPVLLYLHGGPGDPFLGEARSYFPELERYFVVAYWAQRGTAGSYRVGMRDLTVEQMLSDTHELILWLNRHLDRPGLILMGGSWGTTLGAITAARHPEPLLAYVGRAQGVNNPEAIANSYRWALDQARSDGNQEAIDELEALNRESERPGHTPEDQMVLGDWIRRFGGYSRAWQSESGRITTFVNSYLLPMWFSPDLSLADLAHVVANPLFGARVFEEASLLVVETEAPRIEVPVYFLQGVRDVPTPTYLVQRYFEALDAPAGKQLILFDSGHNVRLDEPDKFNQTMRRIGEEICRPASRCNGPVSARHPVRPPVGPTAAAALR
jgi:pimeloyl-ACP methyl ester carboxylesterase